MKVLVEQIQHKTGLTERLVCLLAFHYWAIPTRKETSFIEVYPHGQVERLHVIYEKTCIICGRHQVSKYDTYDYNAKI